MRSFWPAAILAQLCALTQSTIIPRSDCTAIQVQTGEYCDALAQKCSITGNQFTTYNPQPNLCSDLVVGQWVCCSSGTLPDMKPKPSSNGTCYKHTAVSGENCASIGAPLSLTIDDINNFNNNTWGWDGCENLEADQTFCLSTGNPPMPATVPAAVCGPQVNGTQQPADMDNLASLNPCPLNACCNKWGQCGITAEFCTVSKSSTGAPGTSAPGQNGCISNCGMDIVSGSGGGSGRTVGYFEAFNTARECLNMDASQLAGLGYDTVHFGFGELTNDFKPNVTGSADQFATFKTTSGFKKVVSFGGWAFSTDPSTYNVFRTAVTAENRDAFAQNIADFLNTNGMDGVDFDWEYPGAPDIPGIPPGNKDDGDNYLAFLKSLRSVIGSGQTISIAAPASYWYLKQFPIANISQVVDYIVFMTYDLHGQWDYGNKFADEGCPTGGCLRSHVNLTETDQALAMITKAGVDASKIVVGVASYGRSFKMVDPSCTGPNCQFTGPQSGATPGECTNTAGYISNAEISQIQSNDSSAHAWYDQGSDSNIMTYGDGNWVAYMDQNTLKSRSSHYAGYSFAGTVEWAVDLAQWWPAVFEVNGHKVDGTIPVVGKAQKLNSGATCDDLSNWAKANIPENKGNATTTNADMWLESGTDAYFNKWITTVWNELPPAPQGEPNQFSGTFMKIPDLENSWDSCKVENLCKNIDCEENRAANFGNATGEDYMIIVSLYNVAKALSTIYQAVEAAYTHWAAMQSIWVYNFDPTTPSASTVGTKEALNAVAAVVGIAAALLTLPTFGASDAALAAAGAGAAIAGGVSGAVANGLPTATDTTFATLSDFAEYMKKQVDSAMTSIDGLYTGLKDNGNSNGLSYQTMFQNGAWVDETAIGLDAANTTVINNTFEDYINAIALNWAWSHQRVWLMSYPMTQEEYDTTTWYSGNGDSRLRAYYGGRGFFFMSVFPQQNGAYYIPRVQDPPGWGNLTDLGIDLNDVILGSANSYNAGGYGYSITDPAAMFSDPSFDPTTFSMKTPGIFTIPVCALDSSYGWTPTVADFADALAGPGALHNDNDNGDYSPLCWCLRVADSTGKWFDSFVDVGGWEGGSNPQCPPNNQYNTPGGQMYKGSNR